MSARLIRPRTVGRVAKVHDPLLAGEAALSALFVSKREIEMDVGMRGHRARGAAEMIDGFVDLTLFFEHAAQVVARDSVQRVKPNGAGELGARFLGAAHLVEGDAEIDVRVNPLRREFEDLPVALDGLREQFHMSLAVERRLKQFLGCRARHRMKFRG